VSWDQRLYLCLLIMGTIIPLRLVDYELQVGSWRPSGIAWDLSQLATQVPNSSNMSSPSILTLVSLSSSWT
jgi:hypothetical protein